MIPILLLAGAVIAGTGIIAAFWNDIVKFLNKAIEKVKQLVEGTVYGAKVFLQKLSDGIKEISRHYSKVGTVWQETTITRTVSESEVPEEIRNRAKYNQELDITDELEMQLSA